MTNPSELFSLSLNFPFDSAGEPDTRPGTWGNTAFDDGKIQFLNVPVGKRVRIMRIYGDFVCWPHGPVASGKFAGCLFGIITTATAASPYATLSASGCMAYLQTAIGADMARLHFDFDTSVAGLLEADNIMIVRRALFLSELGPGCSAHMEPSMVVLARYEDAPAS
jgi:hypothetical protein